jgi:hypothetical protein
MLFFGVGKRSKEIHHRRRKAAGSLENSMFLRRIALNNPGGNSIKRFPTLHNPPRKNRKVWFLDCRRIKAGKRANRLLGFWKCQYVNRNDLLLEFD